MRRQKEPGAKPGGQGKGDDLYHLHSVPTKLTGKAKREILKALNADTLPPPDVIHLLLYRTIGETTESASPAAGEEDAGQCRVLGFES